MLREERLLHSYADMVGVLELNFVFCEILCVINPIQY